MSPIVGLLSGFVYRQSLLAKLWEAGSLLLPGENVKWFSPNGGDITPI